MARPARPGSRRGHTPIGAGQLARLQGERGGVTARAEAAERLAQFYEREAERLGARLSPPDQGVNTATTAAATQSTSTLQWVEAASNLARTEDRSLPGNMTGR